MASYSSNLKSSTTRFGRWMHNRYHENVWASLDVLGMDTVLDIGPYRGWLFEAMHKKGFSRNYYALDNSNDVLDTIKSLGCMADHLFYRELPELDCGPFHRILCCNVLEHLLPQTAFNTCCEIRGTLTSDGRAIFVVPDSISMGWRFNFTEWQHQFWTTEENVYNMLADAGLTTVGRINLCGPFKGTITGHLIMMFIGIITSRWFPFGRLLRMWPRNKICEKLNKGLATLTISHVFVTKRT